MASGSRILLAGKLIEYQAPGLSDAFPCANAGVSSFRSAPGVFILVAASK